MKFLRRLDKEFQGEVRWHLVMDNYGTPHTPDVRAWFRRPPRFILHFVSTRSRWLHGVERWFRELTSKQLRRGSFCSVQELEKAILEFLEA